MEDKTVREHLIEIRNIFIKVGALALLLFIPLVYISKTIINFFIYFFKLNPVVLYPSEYLNAQFSLALYLSLIIVIPYLVWLIIKYLKPIIPKEDHKNILALFLYSMSCAILGAFIGLFGFGYYTLNFLSKVPDNITLMWGLENIFSYLGFCTWSFALIAQLIIIIPLLNYYNIISLDKLRKARRAIIIIVLFISAILTPTTDILSQFMMAIPMYCMFEGGLIISWIKGTKNINLNTTTTTDLYGKMLKM